MPSTGEGRGEGEETRISGTLSIPLPFIPSHQRRGNFTFYEATKDIIVKNLTLV